MINVVLLEPEIPQNTGNIMRTCVGIGAKLHLIKPFGFSLSDANIKRYAVNYIEQLEYYVYEDIEDFFSKNKGVFLFYTRYATKSYSEMNFFKIENYYLFFGKESTGIDKEILKKQRNNCYRIPTSQNIRSLNLANAVAIVSYEAMRQLNFAGLKNFDEHKGFDFLDK